MSSLAPDARAQVVCKAPRICHNDYAIELFQGPLLAPIHVTGVAGAYIASAEDTEGAAVNSASPAVRDPYSTTWFDYDLAVGVSFPGAFTNTDFDNHGYQSQLGANSANSFTDLTLGGQLQFGAFGVSLTGDLLQYQDFNGLAGASSTSLTTIPTDLGQFVPGGAAALTAQIGRWKALAGYAFLDGQLAVGAGARIITMQMLERGSTLFNMTGAAPEAGLIFMPTGHRWRLGATARAPVTGGAFGSENVTVQGDVRRAGDLVLPIRVTQPWELEAGIALQLGPRPLNPGWDHPHDQEAELRAQIQKDRDDRTRMDEVELAITAPPAREKLRELQKAAEAAVRKIEDEHLAEASAALEKIRKARYANWPREKILLLASVLATGPSRDAVSVEAFLDQIYARAGQSATYTPRLGLEGEPIENRMILRTGVYIEPSRYADGNARQHVTFGADIHLAPLSFWGLLPDADWKLGLVVDLAPRYQNIGFGIGNWH